MIMNSTILGVKITSEEKEKILEYLFARLKNTKEKTFIITPNPEMLVYANKHLAYKDKLNHADIALPDGIGLFLAAGFLGERLQERITGVEFMEDLCKAVREKPLSMGFLGGKAGVAVRTAECLKKKYPYLNIVFASSEWSDKDVRLKTYDLKKKRENGSISHKSSVINEPIDILFVAFGIPKQEEWIYEHLDKIPVKAAIGVGGAFDFLSGTVPRAPFIIRYAGFEWLFRLIVQPWRWKRQLALLEFMSLIFQEKFSANTR
jgi:N-acetylglucosaminyldiphosphoundecaprenol N-acetyl-beta-D-mannosaminyltransferase